MPCDQVGGQPQGHRADHHHEEDHDRRELTRRLAETFDPIEAARLRFRFKGGRSCPLHALGHRKEPAIAQLQTEGCTSDEHVTSADIPDDHANGDDARVPKPSDFLGVGKMAGSLGISSELDHVLDHAPTQHGPWRYWAGRAGLEAEEWTKDERHGQPETLKACHGFSITAEPA